MPKSGVNKTLFLIILFLSPIYSLAALLPFPITQLSVTQPFDSILLKTWSGIKKRNIDAYAIPLVHRPKSEIPGDAVSEGVGYGLLVSLYCNDQVYFNKIWDAAEQYMWAASSYNWRVDINGSVIGSGPATDAEEDITVALIFADQLVKKGVWQSHTSPKNATYAQRAQSMVDDIWNNLVENGIYLRPGNQWGGSAFVNPGYFAPGFYRVFNEFGATAYNWSGLIDQCYASIGLSQGSALGLVPDWMKPDGSFADSTTLGYNAYANGKFCYKDGIRILWRIATDYLWYMEPRAKAFLDKSMLFIKSLANANFFQMNGAAVTDSFKLGNGVTRPRTEHSHLTIGMWATAALASGGTSVADSFSAALMGFYGPGNDFFGTAVDPIGIEDTLHNEMYFDQFLAWFGASLISGTFTDLWEDLKDPNPQLPLNWTTAPVFPAGGIDANINPVKIFGVFNKSARWSAAFKQRGGDSSVQFSGTGETLNVSWYGLSSGGGAMPAGRYDITITAKGLGVPVIGSCWLGRALDLKAGTRLLVDDFRDKDLVPYIGTKWQSYLDSYDGKAGKSIVPIFLVQGADTSVYLRWSFLLNGSSSLGYNPYAALEWNCSASSGKAANLTGLDTIIITAKAPSSLALSVQLITGDITDFNYFQDSLVLSPQWKEFHLPIKYFKHRFAGGSATPTMTLLTGVRFQIQNTDGYANEIQMKRMLFSGSLSALYQSPPPYLPEVIPVMSVRGKISAQQAVRILNHGNGNIVFEVSPLYASGAIAIVDGLGNTVRKLPISAAIIRWDGLDLCKRATRTGVYFAVVSGPGKAKRTVVSFIK
jgi:endo-1,4-beta-D-glucanase Y